MFSSIFKYELSHQFRRPTVWLYIGIFFLIGFGYMAIASDYLGERTVVKGSEVFVNAPISIFSLFKDIQFLILILLPTIFGHAIYRDFKNKMHSVLYSFPFGKREYLAAKFLSALVVMFGIVLATGLGLYFGEIQPWVNDVLVGETNIGGYLQTYLGYVLPNVLIYGAIVFAVVAATRNLYAGLATIVLLMLLRAMIGSFLGGFDNQFLAAIFDPYGELPMRIGTRYWTLVEKNSNVLPLDISVVFNRFFWLAIAGVIGVWGYRKFEVEETAQLGLIERRGAKTQRGNKFQTSPRYRVSAFNMPQVATNFSFLQQLKHTWQLSNIEARFIFTSRTFLLIMAASVVFMFFLLGQVNPDYTTRIHPLTNVMLFIPTFLFSMVISILTFLYAGILIHRSRTAKMNQLVDVTPVSDWSILLSKFIALIKMQMVLLSVIMLVGIFVQSMRGYYNFEIGLYFFDLYIKLLPVFVIWAMLAMFVQSVVSNPLLGTFALVMILFGVAGLESFGIKEALFRYNDGSLIIYSDMDGYGGELLGYFLYKLYWFFFGCLLLVGGYLFTTHGLTFSFGERLLDAKDRFRGKTVWAFALLAVLFIGLGSFIYLEKNGGNKFSIEEDYQNRYEAEIKYSKFKKTIQPRISGAKINMHLFPESRSYESDGSFVLKNKSNQSIDTILVNTSFDDISEVNLSRDAERIISDEIVHLEAFKLKHSLQPGDSINLHFKMKNKPNSIFETTSQIKGNGTFFLPNFPSIGAPDFVIENEEKRKEFGLPERLGPPVPPRGGTEQLEVTGDTTTVGYKNETNRNRSLSDSQRLSRSVPPFGGTGGLNNYYAGNNIDFINFEATVSTTADQIALAPGHLQKEWTENGRRFFQYKTDSPIRNGIVFNSGRFAVKKDKWKDVDLEIYYHPTHDFNLESMMNGMKATLDYCTENFTPYQFKQMRIIEFPKTYGVFAQSFAGTIPYSEFAGFITNVDSSAMNRYDSPFRLTTHEMSHQWWGHQVTPANVRGSKVVTEALAEYSSLKILEKNYGKERMRIFLKLSRDAYLKGRTKKANKEEPLYCAHHHQSYLNYNKGALALYALSDYLGDEILNGALKKYAEKVRFQNAPYTTSVEMIDFIKAVTPDSLMYLVDDLFYESILYDNKMVDAKTTQLENGKYKVDMEFLVSKYESGKGGKCIFGKDSLSIISNEKTIKSLPLKDYIEVGIFDEKGNELYLKKHKITSIKNQISIEIEQQPAEVGIDPWLKLIDTKGEDNRLKINL